MDKTLETTKNEYGNVDRIKITETYTEQQGQYKSSFHYIIKKECNHITNLSKDDADVYTKIELCHDNKIDYDEFLNRVIKHDLSCRLCGCDIKDYASLSNDELDDILEVLKWLQPISEEEYKNQI